jgi:5-formyltetrahydrofolate cyclo-ligase
MTSTPDSKAAARKVAAQRRKAAHDILADVAPMRLAALALPVVPTREQRIISGFYPYQSEIDVRPLLGKLAGEGWTTCLPIVIASGEPLAFRRWLPGEPTVAGMWGIPRPPDEAPEVLPDVLLVPMLAFDRAGFRLGYGGGFYDRTLAKLRARRPVLAIGVAYADQQIDAVPRNSHDQPLDYIMTEKGIITCA